MNDEIEFTPLTKGSVTVTAKAEREKLDFPVGKIIQVHIPEDGARFAEVPKTVTTKDGTEKEIKQKKVVYDFVVDSEVTDTTTKKSLKGKKFSKGITLSEDARATYPGFITAVNGEYSSDPADALGKPLQVMFGAWAKFGEFDYQPVTYLPPAEGQTIPEGDTVPADDEIMNALEGAFGKLEA